MNSNYRSHTLSNAYQYGKLIVGEFEVDWKRYFYDIGPKSWGIRRQGKIKVVLGTANEEN